VISRIARGARHLRYNLTAAAIAFVLAYGSWNDAVIRGIVLTTGTVCITLWMLWRRQIKHARRAEP